MMNVLKTVTELTNLTGRIQQSGAMINFATSVQPIYVVDVNGVLRPLMDTAGRVSVSSGSIPTTAPNNEALGWASGFEWTTSAAGNASIILASTSQWGGTSIPLYRIEAVLYSYFCDGTVQTRTTVAPTIVTGMTKVAGSGIELSMVDTLSLTASTGGTVLFLPNGVRVKQQIGTYTMTAGGSPCPFYANSGIQIALAAATLGVAGDTQRITAWVRQVA